MKARPKVPAYRHFRLVWTSRCITCGAPCGRVQFTESYEHADQAKDEDHHALPEKLLQSKQGKDILASLGWKGGAP